MKFEPFSTLRFGAPKLTKTGILKFQIFENTLKSLYQTPGDPEIFLLPKYSNHCTRGKPNSEVGLKSVYGKRCKSLKKFKDNAPMSVRCNRVWGVQKIQNRPP